MTVYEAELKNLKQALENGDINQNDFDFAKAELIKQHCISEGDDTEVPPPPIPPPPLESAAASVPVTYEVIINNEKKGAFEYSVIIEKIKSGEYKRDAILWTKGMTEWVKAGELPAFENYFEEEPPEYKPEPQPPASIVQQNPAPSNGSAIASIPSAPTGFTGRQKIVYTNGEYDGEWLNGRYHGKGKFSFSNGETYEGDWVNSKRQGRGKSKFASGSTYEGEFYQDLKNGKGKYSWPDGETYEGDYVNDKRQGRGKYTLADGRVFEGRFENDIFVGE